MWENNSSRACSNSVGGDILRGSERFLAMRGVLLSFLGPGAWARGGAVARPPVNRRRNVISCFGQRKGRTTERRGGIIINGQVGRGRGGAGGGRLRVRKVDVWAIHQTKCTVRNAPSDCSRCSAGWRSGLRRSTARGHCSSM